MSETLTAMYDNRSDANAAADKLAEAGISRSAIRVLEGSEAGYSISDQPAYDHARDEGGFWAMLKSLFMPDQDRFSYAEGMSRGSTVLSVTVDADKANMANSILDEYGAIDIQQREAEWTAGGWSGYADSIAPMETTAVPTPSGMVTPEPTDPLATAEEEKKPSATGSGDDPALQAQPRPVDRPGSTNANALFGDKMTETPNPADLPAGSPGVRDDATEPARREAAPGPISRDGPPRDMHEEDDDHLPPEPPRGTREIRRGL